MIGPKHAITGAPKFCGSPDSLIFYSKGKPLKEIRIAKMFNLPGSSPGPDEIPWASRLVVLELEAEVKDIIFPSIGRGKEARPILADG